MNAGPRLQSDARLLDLLGSLCNDALDAAGAAELESLLVADADARRVYRRYMNLHATLGRKANAQRSVPFKPDLSPPHRWPTPTLRPPKRLVYALPGVAAALLLAAAVVAIYVFAFNSKPETRNPKPAPTPVATLIDTTGTLAVNDTIANPGDVIHTGDLSLDTGTADFRLDNGVNVHLTGATRLTVHDPMSATLTAGSATFACPHAAKGYTVRLPGGAKVVDLGTRFAIRVAADGRSLVRVVDGVVELRPVHGDAAQLAAGRHGMFDADGRIVPLTVATYQFADTAAAAFPGNPLVGQDGWTTMAGGRPVLRNDAGVFDHHWAYGPRGGHVAHRPNDDRFACAIPDGSIFVVEADLFVGPANRGGRIGLTDLDGRPVLQFGNNASASGPSRWAVGDRLGDYTLSDRAVPPPDAVVYRVTATVDLADYGGDGALSLAVAPIGRPAVDVPDLQRINLKLASTDGSDLAGLYVNLFNGGGVGAIRVIAPPPAPSAAADNPPRTHSPAPNIGEESP